MWSKRPTFQDEYLPTFNQPHVTLVNTDSKGIERCTSWGVIAKGVEYELNVLILATGFLLALGGNIAPAELFGIPIAGRSARHLKDKYGYSAWDRHEWPLSPAFSVLVSVADRAQ